MSVQDPHPALQVILHVDASAAMTIFGQLASALDGVMSDDVIAALEKHSERELRALVPAGVVHKSVLVTQLLADSFSAVLEGGILLAETPHHEVCTGQCFTLQK